MGGNTRQRGQDPVGFGREGEAFTGFAGSS
jgi:hypothetical protein